MGVFNSLLLSFIFGGLLCLGSQLLINLTRLTTARIMVLYVCLGVFLYAIGVFTPLLETFGCGASLPLIGFGGVIGRGVEKAVFETGILGAFSGPLTASSVGIAVALFSSLLVSIFSKSKPRRM